MIVPIPIPDETRNEAIRRGYVPKVIAGPDGDLTGDIRPVEALVQMVPVDDKGGVLPELTVLIEVDDKDMEILKEHKRFWLVFSGHIVPFYLYAWNPNDGQENNNGS